ncbi:MAG: hypothetical protein KHW91_05560 [Clostridiales bacterium]|nr:hypothetical protein [Clostridiales bacterium]
MRLIEKFAEIHRQVSLRSLTTISWQAFVCFFGLNPFQLQNAPHSALKLHFSFSEMGLRWAAAQTRLGRCPKPRQGTSFPAPSLRCAGLNSDFKSKSLRDTIPQAFFILLRLSFSL